jgi:hypothetical protein
VAEAIQHRQDPEAGTAVIQVVEETAAAAAVAAEENNVCYKATDN